MTSRPYLMALRNPRRSRLVEALNVASFFLVLFVVVVVVPLLVGTPRP